MSNETFEAHVEKLQLSPDQKEYFVAIRQAVVQSIDDFQRKVDASEAELKVVISEIHTRLSNLESAQKDPLHGMPTQIPSKNEEQYNQLQRKLRVDLETAPDRNAAQRALLHTGLEISKLIDKPGPLPEVHVLTSKQVVRRTLATGLAGVGVAMGAQRIARRVQLHKAGLTPSDYKAWIKDRKAEHSKAKAEAQRPIAIARPEVVTA